MDTLKAPEFLALGGSMPAVGGGGKHWGVDGNQGRAYRPEKQMKG